MASQLKYSTVVADFLRHLDEAGIKLVTVGKQVFLYDEGAWTQIVVPGRQDLDKIMAKVCVDNDFAFTEKYTQLWRAVTISLPSVKAGVFDDKGWIATPSGTLDPWTGSLLEPDAEDYITRRIRVEYDPHAECPEWLKMLDRMVEDKSPEDQLQYKVFLQHWFGMALIGFNKFKSRGLRKMLFMYGPPSTAKTSIADTLSAFFHPSDICTANVDQLSSRFGLAELIESKALISDDAVGQKSKMDAKVFKKIITGEAMTAEKKYKDASSFSFAGPVCITANEKPKIEDDTDALYGRIVVLNFDRVFTPSEAKKQLKGASSVINYLEQIGEMPGVLNWALTGMRQAVENKMLPSVASSADTSDEWRSRDNPTFDFVRKYCEFDGGVYTILGTLAYATAQFARAEHMSQLSPRGAASSLGSTIPRVVGGVKVQQVIVDKARVRSLVGLRLNDEGVKWLESAKEAGIIPKGTRLVFNQKVL